MTFEEILDQAMAMLQRRGRLTYGTLKRQFQLDDTALDDLKDEIIYGQRLAVDEEARVLVWRGEPVSAPPPTPAPPSARAREPARVHLASTPAHLAEKILLSRSALEGERKQVTVLFADLQAFAARGLSRFVGRQAEFEILHQALEHAGTSHGQVVAVIGDPGVGKSRLVYEFIRSHHTHDWLVLESSSVSYGKATAYLPVRDLLKAYFQIDDRDDGRKVREKLTGKLLTLDAALGPTLPAFLTLLDVPVEDRHWQALALAEELGMRPLQAHCHLGLGTLYAKTGQREQARAELSTAIEMYRAMAMTFWLPQAEVALAQVEEG